MASAVMRLAAASRCRRSFAVSVGDGVTEELKGRRVKLGDGGWRKALQKHAPIYYEE